MLNPFFLPFFLGTHEYLDLKTILFVYGRKLLSFKTAELDKEIIHCKMSPVNGANLERGSHREYLTGCSEVFRKSLDWKKGETDFTTGFFIY